MQIHNTSKEIHVPVSIDSPQFTTGHLTVGVTTASEDVIYGQEALPAIVKYHIPPPPIT